MWLDPLQAASLIHVATAADQLLWPGVVGVVNSLYGNTESPERLRVHVIVGEASVSNFTRFMSCHGLSTHAGATAGFAAESGAAQRPRQPRVIVHAMRRGVLPAAQVHARHSTNGNLASPLNFARFDLVHLLYVRHGVRAVLYLDADVVVRGDAVALLSGLIAEHQRTKEPAEMCAAVPRAITLGGALPTAAAAGTAAARGDGATADGAQQLQLQQLAGSLRNARLDGPALGTAFAARYGRTLPLGERSFNAGVFAFLDLGWWHRLNLTGEVAWWVEQNNRRQLYKLGSQPPLTLALMGRVGRGCAWLPSTWNCDGLGSPGRPPPSAAALSRAKLLHWNGPLKPFRTSGRRNRTRHVRLFAPYAGRGDACSWWLTAHAPPHSAANVSSRGRDGARGAEARGKRMRLALRQRMKLPGGAATVTATRTLLAHRRRGGRFQRMRNHSQGQGPRRTACAPQPEPHGHAARLTR